MYTVYAEGFFEMRLTIPRPTPRFCKSALELLAKTQGLTAPVMTIVPEVIVYDLTKVVYR